MADKAKITKTHLALRVLRDHQVESPRAFGLLLWPDNPNWRHSGKSGNGQAKGVGMRLAAGGLLGRLRQQGLISNNYPVIVRDPGLKMLKDAGL